MPGCGGGRQARPLPVSKIFITVSVILYCSPAIATVVNQEGDDAARKTTPALPPGRARLLSPQRHFGTYHYEIPGVVTAPNGTSSTVLLHVFLRALATTLPASASSPEQQQQQHGDSGVELRGFFYGEALDTFEYFGTVMGGKMIYNSLANFPREALPKLALRAAAQIDSPEAAATHNSTAELVADLPVGGVIDDVRLPLSVGAMLDRKQLEQAHWLAVEGWPRAAALGDLPRHVNQPKRSQQQGGQQALPRVLFISYPLWGVPDDQKRLLLKVSMEWHIRMGFAGHVQYAPSASPLEADPHLAAWLADGRLALVSWRQSDTGLARPPSPGCRRYDKALLYNHAILSHWGSGAHLFIADVDEFLATPGPPGVAALLGNGGADAGCLAATADQAKLRRKDVACYACHVRNEIEISMWLQHADRLQQQQQQQQQQAGAAVPPAANPATAAAPGDLVDAIFPQYNRLLRGDDHVKSLVNPDAVRQFHVHNGPVEDGQPPLASPHSADPRCAFVVHAKHLYGSRLAYKTVAVGAPQQQDSLETSYEESRAWQWPLQGSGGAGGSSDGGSRGGGSSDGGSRGGGSTTAARRLTN